MLKIAMTVTTSQKVSCPIDCNTSSMTGKPAIKPAIMRGRRTGNMPFAFSSSLPFIRLEISKTVKKTARKSKIGGTMSSTDGSFSGFVTSKNPMPTI